MILMAGVYAVGMSIIGRLRRVQAFAHEPPHRLKQLHKRALEIAKGDLGKGESGGRNNCGEYVEWIRSIDGTGGAIDTGGAWCSAFASSLFTRASMQLEIRMPCRTSRWATGFYRLVGKFGRFVEEPAPGDLVCWKRHIGIVEWRKPPSIACASVSFGTICGNKGRYPAPVKRRSYSLEVERKRGLLGFARLW
jgi:hypothetical protein